ncbi:hypothetical protein [Pararobbsia alpina]|uniref:hypothetical protein n=1 Tax=Pararobbsia alpina TaxID=621374 RepID=UPI0039A4A0FA
MPLNYVNKVAQALRTFLRTGFRIATSQSDNKAIGNTEEAYTRNLRATLETERYETFMEYRLACPLGLSRVEFEARGVGIATPIVRRVMLAIHDQIGELYDTIVNREQREFLSSARQSGWNDTSASFVEAFLNLFDVDRGYSLEVRFLWGGGFPNEGRHLAQPLTFRSGDSLFVHDLYHAMACREESDVYVGVLAHLQRGQGAASAVGPRAVLTLLLANGDVIPAHVDLSEAQYSKARQAQESGHQYVRVGGVLETVDQPGQLARLELTRLTEFDVIG